jgi:hypothetical protein
MTRIAFSTKVLEDYSQFEKYLESKDAIEAIRAEAKKPYVPGEARLGVLSITWLGLTTFFRPIYALFLQATGNLLYYATPLSKTGLYLYVEGTRQAHYDDLFFYNYYLKSHSNILVDCMNVYTHDAYEIYTQESISLDEISLDWNVRDNFHPKYIDDEKKLIQITSWGGVCAGISGWVAYLYYQTKYDFNDPEHHLVSVVKQVREGASAESALMQMAQNSDYPLLGLNQYLVDDWVNPTQDKVQRAFESLSTGLYHIYSQRTEDSPAHGQLLAVARNNLYLLEPNTGLIKDTPENFAEKLHKNKDLMIFEIS